MPETIDRREVQARLATDDRVVVLEALPPDHYDRDHIPGALNLPHDQVDALAPQLVPDKTTPVIVYCANAACANSGVAARRLEELGYTDVSVYEAGKEDWFAAGFPLDSTAASTH